MKSLNAFVAQEVPMFFIALKMNGNVSGYGYCSRTFIMDASRY